MPYTFRDQSLFVGGYTKLKVQVTSNTQTSITADRILLLSDVASYVATSVSLTNTITTSGVNGRDTGAEAANTWYYVWVIYNETSGTVASLISTSSTSPTMPSGYTYKARVGAIRNDASSNLHRTLQYDNITQIVIGTNPTSAIKMSSGVTPNTSTPVNYFSISEFVPATAIKIRGFLYTSNSRIGVAPNGNYSVYSDISNPPPVVLYVSNQSTVQFDFIIEESNLYWLSNGSNNFIAVLGWVDSI
jgi:hypothetical protein